jgi:hypothetical protein
VSRVGSRQGWFQLDVAKAPTKRKAEKRVPGDTGAAEPGLKGEWAWTLVEYFCFGAEGKEDREVRDTGVIDVRDPGQGIRSQCRWRREEGK